MSSHSKLKIDIGVATVILALATIVAAIISKVDSNSSSGTTETSTTNNSFVDTGVTGTGEIITDESTFSDNGAEEGTETKSSNEYDENINVIFTHKNGKIELTDDHSGVAYIYKSLLDEMPIGTITSNNQPSSGWQISLIKGTESFGIFLFSETHTPPIERCLVQYNVLGDCQIIFSDTPNYFYNDSGDLQIEFSYNNIPFDLRKSDAINVDYVLS